MVLDVFRLRREVVDDGTSCVRGFLAGRDLRMDQCDALRSFTWPVVSCPGDGRDVYDPAVEIMVAT